ncbi:uncharacterized protein [Symphalangus syndactylus]|uniref:uncharacterized protein n=1 Tax=Symphalangus syndactylus TaxID=9590 RepID=UPI003004E859
MGTDSLSGVNAHILNRPEPRDHQSAILAPSQGSPNPLWGRGTTQLSCDDAKTSTFTLASYRDQPQASALREKWLLEPLGIPPQLPQKTHRPLSLPRGLCQRGVPGWGRLTAATCCSPPRQQLRARERAGLGLWEPPKDRVGLGTSEEFQTAAGVGEAAVSQEEREGLDHSLCFLFWRKATAQRCWLIILQPLSLEPAAEAGSFERPWEPLEAQPATLRDKLRLQKERVDEVRAQQ